MNDRYAIVVQEADVWLATTLRITGRGPHFRIVHRFRECVSGCLPGEEITSVMFLWGSHEIVLKLTGMLLLLFEYLARHRHLPLSAAQIAAGLQTDAFFTEHGTNTKARVKRRSIFSYSAVKEYIKRLRRALQSAFDEAGLKLDPFAVLASEPTESNGVRYRLKAIIDWIHV